jgi:pyruvate/2-oxoglutarate dehydrogenase complex dihydrolipoamide dehydrogenase (E3) component
MKNYDLIVIGMGPAGMAVSAMGVSMGLNVLSIERRKIGGECLNCGCIPSKALLKGAEAFHGLKRLSSYGIDIDADILKISPMSVVRDKIDAINSKKTMKMFEKVSLVSGEAVLDGPDAVRVNGRTYRGKRIFIATGTSPAIPPIPGLKDLPDILTNENLFQLEEIPKSMTIIGGGAIGSEMGQAFARLGTNVTIVHMDPHLVPTGDEAAGRLLEKVMVEEGVVVRNSASIDRVEKRDGSFFLYSGDDVFESEKLLVAAGRVPSISGLRLGEVGVNHDKKGISVDQRMRTSVKNIYAIGDCNGQYLLSHAAMHQGMLAFMDALSPFSLPWTCRDRYVVPWAVFTEPEIAQVGITEKEASKRGLNYDVCEKKYSSYGRTVADGHPEGFVKIIVGKSGKILGATVMGEGASELIQEWTMAIQDRRRMTHIMMTQHPFPSVGTINKMVAEEWMMSKMRSPILGKLARFILR